MIGRSPDSAESKDHRSNGGSSMGNASTASCSNGTGSPISGGPNLTMNQQYNTIMKPPPELLTLPKYLTVTEVHAYTKSLLSESRTVPFSHCGGKPLQLPGDFVGIVVVVPEEFDGPNEYVF